MTTRHILHWPAPHKLRGALAALTAALLVAACGGGGGTSSGGTGAATDAQIASGVVTGFGSVFVDGVEIEDASALTQAENPDGSMGNVALKLGQHVRVEHDGKGTASKVTVDAAVIGSVSQINTTTSEIKVAGQWVKANADSAAGPVTAYGGGYTAFADIAAADLVEVHGSPVYNATLAAYEVQASRIEKKAAITAVKVAGKLAALDSTAKKFMINGLTVNYTSATVTPATVTLANDQVVAVWGPSGSLSSPGGVLTLSASRVHVLKGKWADNIASGLVQVGGLVSSYNAGSRSFEIEGVRVNMGTVTVVPAAATLGNGSYVRVTGTVGGDGTVAATAIRVREQDTVDDTARIKLAGLITTFTDTSSFVVRDVPVDASAINLATACPGVTLATGVFVQIAAVPQVGTDVVKAVNMACRSAAALPPIVVREVKGVAGSVNATSKTFTVTRKDSTTQAVAWSDKTAFEGVSSSTLAGATVTVSGLVDGAGVLNAREVQALGVRDADKYDKDAGGKGWDDYINKFLPGKR